MDSISELSPDIVAALAEFMASAVCADEPVDALFPLVRRIFPELRDATLQDVQLKTVKLLQQLQRSINHLIESEDRNGDLHQR